MSIRGISGDDVDGRREFLLYKLCFLDDGGVVERPRSGSLSLR